MVPGLLAGGPTPVCTPGHAALPVSRTPPESSQGKEDIMLLGIDYGTTRTVVAAVDRGNYPVISFYTANGDTQDWYPSLIASRGDEHLFGLDAACCQDDPGWNCCGPSSVSWQREAPRQPYHWAPAPSPPWSCSRRSWRSCGATSSHAPTCASGPRNPWRPWSPSLPM